MTKPTRLVFCITELDPGGAERALVQLVSNLDRAEWEPFVICLGPRGVFADPLEAVGIPVICLNARGIASMPRVLWQLTRQLSRLRPALVQTFLFHANILGRIAACFAGIWRVVSGIRVAEHRNRWHGWVDRFTNFLVTTNVCVSQGVADYSVNQTGLSPRKLMVIPNSVEFDRFAHASPADLSSTRIPSGSRVFISIGRLERQKGIDILLEAVGYLTTNSPIRKLELNPLPDNVHFLIVGDGPDANDLRSFADRFRVSERVHFVGRRDDVPELLAASTALILSSRWEGMPNVVLEAMAAGRPVIATQVEGIAELIQNQVTGLTVPPEDPTELARAIIDLISNDEMRVTFAEKSQDAIAKQFAIQAVVQSYSELYRRLLDLR